LSRASEKALERLDAAVRHYGPEFLSKGDMRELQRLAKRTEAAEREAEELRARMRLALCWVRQHWPAHKWVVGDRIDDLLQTGTPRATKPDRYHKRGEAMVADMKRAGWKPPTKDATRGARRKRRRR
jgi:hypothetical protein